VNDALYVDAAAREADLRLDAKLFQRLQAGELRLGMRD